MIEFRNFKKGYTATIYLQTLFLFLEMHEIGKVGKFISINLLQLNMAQYISCFEGM